MKTKNGLFLIFDITEYLPGRPIPPDYLKAAEEGGPFFFMPSNWTEENDWQTFSGRFRRFPMLYSPGYQTAEEALAAAEGWESTKDEREQRDQANYRAIFGEDPKTVVLADYELSSGPLPQERED